MRKLLFTLGIIVFGLALGYGGRILADRGRLRLPLAPLPLRILLQRVALLGIYPVAFLGAAWAADLDSPRLLVLPLLSLTALAAGLVLARLAAVLLRLPRQSGIVLATAGSFTNIGSLGGLVVYVFLGEAAFAYVPFYKLFEDLWNYGVLFPLARSAGETGTAASAAGRFRRILADPFLLTAVASFGAGFALNLAGVPRPDFFLAVNAVLIPLGTFLLLVSIGLALRFGPLPRYLREAGYLAAIKFVLVPALTVGLAALAGLGRIAGGTPLRAVLILSAMPVGFTALVPPTLYGLDLDLANACWFWSNAMLPAVLPLLLLVLARI